MGFWKRLLGLETRPGESEPLTDTTFDEKVLECKLPCFVLCFSLWCSPCQVMGGLLNEVGPGYLGKARFFKLDVSKNPHAPGRYQVKGVPTILVFSEGGLVARGTGLIPLNDLKEWIENQL